MVVCLAPESAYLGHACKTCFEPDGTPKHGTGIKYFKVKWFRERENIT